MAFAPSIPLSTRAARATTGHQKCTTASQRPAGEAAGGSRASRRHLTRRNVLIGTLAMALPLAHGLRAEAAAAASASGDGGMNEMGRTEAEWRERLSFTEFAVLRKSGTEPPFSSALNAEKRPGVFTCAGCDSPLFASAAKFDSGTGWPSFLDRVPDAVVTRKSPGDMFLMRTEVACATCGGHLGHVFNDGPRPTGKRYCINGVALRFKPQ